jgi:uncharacterized protein YbcC (UPF0753/DUF2309 family)
MTEQPSGHFDAAHVLHELRHMLPAQQALKDFIHHNSLHAFQDRRFYDAIFEAADLFGYQVHLELSDYRGLYKSGRIRADVLKDVIRRKKGDAEDWEQKMLHGDYDEARQPRIGRLRALWKTNHGIDLDELVHPRAFRILCAYLDQGIAGQAFPVLDHGFMEDLRILDQRSALSIFRTNHVRGLFRQGNYTLEGLLEKLVGDPAYFRQYLFDTHFAHPGWSGFVSAAEQHPSTLLDARQINLREWVEFELLMELDALMAELGTRWKPLSQLASFTADEFNLRHPRSEYTEVIELWQDAFEWSYYDAVLKGLQRSDQHRKSGTDKQQKFQASRSFQAIFCIDEREDSLRRHLEAMDPRSETFGAPGFFGVEFYFQQEGSIIYDKLCPAPVTPAYLIKESRSAHRRKGELLYAKNSHHFLTGIGFSLVFGVWAFVRMARNLISPTMSPAISNAFGHMDMDSELSIENRDPNHREGGLQIGYTIEEMTMRAEGFLRGIGLTEHFAPLVYIVAHGSSSANNPHHGAHDCGACSGRPGAVNARVMAFILNHRAVRESLKARGIHIPQASHFLGCMHDTAADVVGYYDEKKLTGETVQQHESIKLVFENALDLNAKERSRRFASIDTRQKLRSVRKAIHDRSVSLFEPRPELGHGTNTLAVIGRRSLTRRLFLDRRAFLNSYDPTQDPEGTILSAVMRPIGLVCGGINLEYYFSRVDNIRMGAGTKLPHNVMGLFGVANSSDGDLRPGLPWQMIEVHDPVRLMVIVEHRPEIVLKAVKSSPAVFEWYGNEWVHLVSFDPETGDLHYFRNGAFERYHPLTKDEEIGSIRNMTDFLESAREMETNHIIDATEENLPVLMLE